MNFHTPLKTKNFKKIFVYFLIFSMMFYGTPASATLAASASATLAASASTNKAASKKNVKLSKKKLQISVNSTKKLKLKNAKSKTKWKLKSGKGIIKLTKKKKKSVKIKGLKVGTAIVVAKSAGKKYNCRVKVVESDSSASSSTNKTPTSTSTAAATTPGSSSASSSAPLSTPSSANTTPSTDSKSESNVTNAPASNSDTTANPSENSDNKNTDATTAPENKDTSETQTPSDNEDASETQTPSEATATPEASSTPEEAEYTPAEYTYLHDITVSEPTTTVAPFTDLTASEITEEMGAGINIGNTLDAVSNFKSDPISVSEYAWGATSITDKTFPHIKELGFKCVRIPITWGNTTNDSTYVNATRLSRVKEVVDMALDAGLYVVINVHHDGASDNTEYKNFLQLCNIQDADNVNDPIYDEFRGLWKSIAITFKNYDEHLIFENMNEVYEAGNGWSGKYSDLEKTSINNLNQYFVDVVRTTGANNAKRWLVVPTKNTEMSLAAKSTGFTFPSDTLASPRLMLAVHSYINIGTTSVDESNSSTLAYSLKSLKENYVDNGIPVFLGEYGPNSMTTNSFSVEDSKNTFIYEVYNFLCKKYGAIPMTWDTSSIVNRYGNTESGGAANILNAIYKGFYTDTELTDIEGLEGLSGNSKYASFSNCIGTDNSDIVYFTKNGDYTLNIKDLYNSSFSSNSNWYLQTNISSSDNIKITIKSGYATVNGNTVDLTPVQSGYHLDGSNYQITIQNPYNHAVDGFSNITSVYGASIVTMVISVSGL